MTKHFLFILLWDLIEKTKSKIFYTQFCFYIHMCKKHNWRVRRVMKMIRIQFKNCYKIQNDFFCDVFPFKSVWFPKAQKQKR